MDNVNGGCVVTAEGVGAFMFETYFPLCFSHGFSYLAHVFCRSLGDCAVTKVGCGVVHVPWFGISTKKPAQDRKGPCGAESNFWRRPDCHV